MARPSFAKPARHTAADESIEATGWDSAGQGGEQSWYPEPAPAKRVRGNSWWRIRRGLMIAAMALVVVVGATWVLMPTTCGCSKIGTNETASVQNLKALATAQAQYIKKQDAYAASGKELNETGTLIAADLKNAFEDWQQNGDSRQPQPKAGYIYRMLQGDQAGDPRSYWKDATDQQAGMNTWAATCRAATPGTSGENQYLITEAGMVYKHVEPDSTSPQYKTFLIGDLSSLVNSHGGLDPKKLAAVGWTTAK